MKKIIALIGTDKLLHASISWVMTMELRRLMPWWAAALTVLTAGVVKEVYDKLSKNGTPEWKDLLANVVGIALGCI